MATTLHDTIGQALAFCKIKLGTIQESAGKTNLDEPIQEIRALINESIQNTRSLTTELSPPVLHELGFKAAIEWLADHMIRQHRLSMWVEDDKEKKPLDDEISTTLFSAVRELLTNVIKHAQATNVMIRLRRQNDHIEVRVEDDGIGFDLSQFGSRRDGSFGLFNIRERITLLGGRVEIDSRRRVEGAESTPSPSDSSSSWHGTHVILVAPLKKENSSQGSGNS